MPDWSGGKPLPEVTGGSADRDAAAPGGTSPVEADTAASEAPAAAPQEEEAGSAPTD
ncbi:hypothetical protein AB0F92_41055 [Kitasatospora aureofaciens]|uniref:hypothetical protein n=1 Tax=Kitasatospora aureofaciens TaxID=1894 RepID=UPI000AA51484|nr:hypothetical protein [Kitasatospora aureofaciens]UKZ09986.1 hypothetical protein BOQ63_039425 [Streptomyces viridifaciens]